MKTREYIAKILKSNFVLNKSFVNTAWLHLEYKRTDKNYTKTFYILINKKAIIKSWITEGKKNTFFQGSYYNKGIFNLNSLKEFTAS